MIQAKGLKTLIEVDGGVNLENASLLVQAGADVLVAGNTVFNAPDPIAMVSQLKRSSKFFHILLIIKFFKC